MIIDEILERGYTPTWNASDFKDYVLKEADMFGMDYFAEAFDEPNDDLREIKVKKALIRYILDEDYNTDIIRQILIVNWT